MKTIAILNLKGGTGKTVTAANFARCLATDYEKDVLLIDGDCQGSLSQCFDVPAAEVPGDTYRLMTGGVDYWPDFVAVTETPHLDIIPADTSLARVELLQGDARKLAQRQMEVLRIVLEEDSAYDYCIIDLGPSLGLVTQAALFAADEIIIPVRLDRLNTAGMAELVKQVGTMREVNPRLRVAGVLGTQYQRTDEERELHRLLAVQSGLPVFRTLIRSSAPVLRSVNHGTSLFEESPSCGAAKDYRAFVKEYMEREAAVNGKAS